MGTDDFLKIVSQVGIPSAISMYVLIVLNRTLKDVQHSIDRNTRVITALLAKVDLNEELKKMLSNGGKSDG